MKSISKKLALTAMMTALCTVATYAVSVPFPSGIGYFNLGDVFVILAGWLLGPVFGALAAGLGSMLADLFLGFTAYMPATFLIKAAVALISWALYALLKKLIRKDAIDFLPRLVAGLAAEAVMVLGYLFFEGVVLGLGAGALASVVGNMVQAACGLIGGTITVSALYPIPVVRRLFPALAKPLDRKE